MAKTRTRRKLGLRITTLRERKGWTQQELADRADMHQTYLCGVENGRRNCTVDVLDRIADAFGKDVGDLFKP
ncbi:helix-turn-helix protein [Brevundimonas phage vB_BpoS-Strzyga]|nr:helix-turn-helix protein [Brevundimonas phage vB_BpoS-Polewnik]USN16737.1 helix-turn-helix protein [Brevundimonas phage vB_BpoS-Strzyga]